MSALQDRQRALFRDLTDGNLSDALVREGARHLMPIVAAVGFGRAYARDNGYAAIGIALALMFAINLLTRSASPRSHWVTCYPMAFTGLLLAQDSAARTLSLGVAVIAFSTVLLLQGAAEITRLVVVSSSALGAGTTTALAWLMSSGSTTTSSDDLAVLGLGAAGLGWCMALCSRKVAPIAAAAVGVAATLGWSLSFVDQDALWQATAAGLVAAQFAVVMYFVVCQLLSRGLELRVAEHLINGIANDTRHLNELLHQHVLNVLAQTRAQLRPGTDIAQVSSVLAAAEDRIRRLRAVEAAPAANRIEEVLHACARSVTPAVQCTFSYRPSDIDLAISTDEATELEWIADELLTNAAKHAGDGLEPVKVTVSATRGPRQITVLLHDDGPGFQVPPAGTLARLMTPTEGRAWTVTKANDIAGGSCFSLQLQYDAPAKESRRAADPDL